MEWIRIFEGEAAARTRIVPGKPQLLIVNGTRICLALYNNEFFAVQDSCSHNGESLSGGKINHLGEIICPWHGYRFRLKSGQAADSSCPDLRIYPIRLDQTGFYIGI